MMHWFEKLRRLWAGKANRRCVTRALCRREWLQIAKPVPFARYALRLRILQGGEYLVERVRGHFIE